MDTADHFILTRFNVVSRGMTQRDPTLRLNKSWLEARFDLFERYCLPSVRGQTNQNFTWLVFFDVDTPEQFARRLSHHAEWKNLIPVPMQLFDLEGVRQAIAKIRTRPGASLITTRLDNDDAIHDAYVAAVQSRFACQTAEVINILHGYQLHEGKAYHMRHPGNPFISLIETGPDVRTVLDRNHDEWEGVATVTQVKGLRGWVQVIHKRNAANQLCGVRCPVRELGNGFQHLVGGLEEPEREVTLRWDQVRTFVQAGLRFLKRRAHLKQRLGATGGRTT
jgi:hypothetical protein